VIFVTLPISKERTKMPLIEMKEISTPLKLIGLKFFKSREGEIYIKVGNRPRKKLFS